MQIPSPNGLLLEVYYIFFFKDKQAIFRALIMMYGFTTKLTKSSEPGSERR